MSSTELNREFLAAEILATGKRQCWTCRTQRDAHSGKYIKLGNGTKQWRCAPCCSKIKPATRVS